MDVVVLIISYFSLAFLALSTLVLIFFWKDYYFIYNHRLLFVIGLEFSRSLTDYAVISVVIYYFTNYGGNLVLAAILTNFQGSLSSLLVIFMAHAANSYVGRFNTLLFSNTAYIGGLMLLWWFNPYDVKWLLVISLVLLSLGTSGANILQDVLKDLVNDIDKSQDRNTQRSLARAAIWSRIAYVCGVMSAILWVATDAVGGVHPSWRTTFFICMITMAGSSIIFCAGRGVYRQDELIERPANVFFRVFRVHIKKLIEHGSRRSTNVSRQVRIDPKNSGSKRIGDETISQDTPTLSSDTKDMVIVKSLLRMFPMWSMFISVSIISATGFTFFLQQFSNLHMNEKIPVQIYNIVQDVSFFAIPFLYSWIKCVPKNEKVKIGVGMFCGIVSCVFAWRLEVYRLKEVDKDKNSETSISFLWLVPQFCALGCMEGLTLEGVLKFYKMQMKEQQELISYGEEYLEIVMGIGKLINIVLILIFDRQRGWFKETINNSRLDKYYLVLVCVCSTNFVVYCFIALCFYKDGVASYDQDEDNQVLANDDEKQDHKVLAIDDRKHDNQVLASDDQKQDLYGVFAKFGRNHGSRRRLQS